MVEGSVSHGGAWKRLGRAGRVALFSALLVGFSPQRSRAAAPTPWSEPASLVKQDDAIAPSFGSAVALSGNTAAVGASDAAIGDVARRGAVYVFEKAGAAWSQQGPALAPSGPAQDFGYALALAGNTLVVGAPGASDAAGAVYVFVRTGSTWSQQGAPLSASDGDPGARFGSSVSLLGESLLVGAPLTPVDATHLGAAYVFMRSGDAWQQQRPALTNPDSDASALFGASVALWVDGALIGAPQSVAAAANANGHAYLFGHQATDWWLVESTSSPSGEIEARYGAAVALGAIGSAVGSPSSALLGADSGTVDVRFGPHIGLSGTSAGAEFGAAVGLSGDWLAIGSPGALRSGEPRGDFNLFRAHAGGWLTLGGGVQPAPALAGDLGFGRAVAIDASTVVVGSRGATGSSGAAYVLTACAVSGVCCVSGSDCSPDAFCSRVGLCTPRLAIGESCSGSCLDGADCPDCKVGACLAGQCRETNQPVAHECVTDEECASGVCADNVCCQSACGQPCQACAEPGSEGTCSIVAGLPRGVRVHVPPAEGQCATACNGRRIDRVVSVCAIDCANDADCAADSECVSRKCRLIATMGGAGNGNAGVGGRLGMAGSDSGADAGNGAGSTGDGVAGDGAALAGNGESGQNGGSAPAAAHGDESASACGCRLGSRPRPAAPLLIALSVVALGLRRRRYA